MQITINCETDRAERENYVLQMNRNGEKSSITKYIQFEQHYREILNCLY